MVRTGKIIFFFLFCVLVVTAGRAQVCTGRGQNPATAFPVCGTTFFRQTSVPACGGTNLPTTCGGTAQYSDINPYWYKFTCYASGTLGFVITPKNLKDDYDWQLFDVTGRNPGDVYIDPSLIVSSNWSGSFGVTGASPAGKAPFECASDPTQGIPTFSTMPNIIVGHDYLLLISHFDGATQSGYDLSFPTGQQGGTASIVNPVIPQLQSARGVCDGTEIAVKLNKYINCATLANDGSDFTLTGPGGLSIVSAIANGCATGFDADTLILKLNGVLRPGRYTVTAKVGTDGNTLTDNCANNLESGDNTSFSFLAATPTPMDSIKPVVCISDSLTLVFSRPINCTSIAADGSDFRISGPAPVTVRAAKGFCNGEGMTGTIAILLAAPIRVNGTFTITLRNGTDGNSLIDQCGFTTPAGSTLPFTTKDITTADFQSAVAPGCKYDTVFFTHNGNGAANKWQWLIDSVAGSNVQNPVYASKIFGTHKVKLVVGNGKCTDSANGTFVLPDLTVKASFAALDTICPTDTLHFTDQSTSNANAWKWDFGNGNTSTGQTPPAQSYPLTGRRNSYVTRLSVQNAFNCADTAYKMITVLASCYIAVPSAFTPNGDGLNDYLYPLNAFKADNLIFRVYNRYGQLIFQTRDWTRKWDGRLNSVPQGSGTYVWTLDYTDRDNAQKVSLKGTTVLIR
ncbi:MAG: domain containing protein [Sediminibacterium sp.]|nr:domain containing protein [Sediminibacterium sp.]